MAETPKRWRWTEAIPLVVGFGLLAYVISRYPLGEILAATRRIGPPLLLTPLVALGWHACNTSAFRVLLDGKVPWGALYWNRLVGDGYNNLLPLAGIGGEPFKLRHLSRYLPTERVVAALIRDRVIESAFGLLFTSACLAYAMGHVKLPPPLRAALWAFVGASFVIAMLAGALVLSALPGRAGQLIARWLGGGSPEAFDGLSLGQLGRVLAWHLPARLLGLVEIAILFHLLGLPVSFATVAFTDNLLNAAGFISFAIPQGIGVFEGTTVYLFGLLGFAGPIGIAFALARRGRLLIVSMLGVLLHLVTFGKVRGRPRAATDWDAEYARGHWSYLDSTRELGHYALIAGYVHQLSEKPRVLDVGCGHGRLYKLLRGHRLASYLGIDVSTSAISQAQQYAEDGVEFAVGDFESKPPEGSFDVIIFNESIYYASDPPTVFSRYVSLLPAQGIVIVSIRDMLKNRRLRKTIHLAQPPAHSSAVTNDQGERWHVDVFLAGDHPARRKA